MLTPRPSLAAALVGLSLFAACLPGARPPAVPARSALSLDEAGPRPPRPAEGPLAVLFAGPQGDAAEGAEISVVFNKPMRELGRGPSDPPPPVTLTPAAKGAFHWVGSTALRFDADEPLPPGTSYRVAIAAGARALDGSTLSAPFVFDFSTPRVRLVEMEPADGARDVAPDTKIALRFSQHVTDAEIQRAVSVLRGRAGAAIPFDIARRDAEQVDLVPSRPLPLAEQIRVRVDASLRGASGDLPAGKDRQLTFHTAEPPAVVGVRCAPHPEDAGACDPSVGGVVLEVTRAISSAALARAVEIDPPAEWDRKHHVESDYPVTEIDVHAEWKPGTSYKVRVRRGPTVVDAFGQQLASDGARTLRFGSMPSSVRFGLRGTYWSASRAKHAFSALTTNTTGAVFHAVPRSADELLRALGGGPIGAPPAGPGVTLVTRGLDESAETPIKLDDLLPGARGAIELVAAYASRDGRRQHRESHQVQITDLGVTARLGHGGAAVLLTDLAVERPIAGAAIELHRLPEKGAPARLAQATSGPDGTVALRFDEALGPEDKLAIVARRGDDWTLRTIGTPRAPQAVGSIFFERGLYRPGETAKLTGVFRVPGPSGLSTPRRGSVRVKLSGPERAKEQEIEVALSEFGTFTTDVTIPREAPVGMYYAEATFGEGHARTRLLAAEYRPTEVSIEVSTDKPAYTRGDTLQCRVRGRYLHGGAMAGGVATVVVTRSRAWFQVPNLDGFSVDDSERSDVTGEIGRVTGKLDARGGLTFPLSLAQPATGASRVSCAAEVMDLNRHALAGEAEALLHPGELYAAIGRATHRSLRAGDTLRVPVLAVTPAGERRAAKVHVELWRRDRDSAAERRVDTCEVMTGASGAACAFTVPRDVPEDGRVIVRASVTDARGNVAHASEGHHVEAPRKPEPRAQPAAAPAKPAPPAPRELRVSTASEQTVGQTGHIDIESPFARPSRALVTIEREGILWQRAVEIPGDSARVDFPVQEAMIPSAHVSVVLVSEGAVLRGGDSFEVDPAPKKLDVKLEVSGGEAHVPGESVDVNVSVRDASGKPARAEITLWAADEGTLSLTDYLLPLPIRHVFGWRRELTTHADSRDDRVIVGHTGSRRAHPPLVRMGATHSSMGEPRSEFRQTAFFAAHLVTDDAGKLQKRFTLPDGLTTYRVMAVAVSADDRLGSQQTNIVTSLPLMARASLPRVIRVGDRFEASVVLTAKEAGLATLTAESNGLTLLAPAARTIKLEAGEPAELRLAVRADRAGAGKITVRATQGKAADSMTLTREVVPPLVPESAAIDGETSDAAAEALGDLSTIRPDYGGLEISLASTPLAGLADGIEQLVEYPYGCTEQTVSRLVPLLALRDLAEPLGLSLPAKTGGAVDEAIRRLVTHQRRDGGFGLWRESGKSEPWLTAWALWGLGEARRRGASVPATVEPKAQTYLREVIGAGSDLPPDRLALAAFLADLRALDGAPDVAAIDRLLAARDRLPPFSRALLLHAMALGKHDPARVAELSRELENLVRLDGAAARVVTDAPRLGLLWDSDTRTTAMLLRGLVAADPKHPLIPRLARALLESRRGGRFRNTHDAAWALLALDELRRSRPAPRAETAARVFLGEALLSETRLSGARPASLAVPASALLAASNQPLTFASDGPLHYHARLRFARTALPTAPVESGMFLRRTTRPASARAPLPGDAFVAGELVVVELDLGTPSPRHAVVVESPLPAGLEPVDADIRLGGSWLANLEQHARATRRELRDDRVLYFFDDLPAGLTVLRYVARAITPGTFVAPPARAEEMYAPDTFARTAAESLTIAAP